MVSDTIGDFIIRLKNAGMVKKDKIEVPYSKLRHSIANKLQTIGYVADVTVAGEGVHQSLIVTLHYNSDETHSIRGVTRTSKPGRRVYKKVEDIHPVKFGSGHMILSTPAGILTGEEAKNQNVGGEQLFIIW